MAAKKGKGKKEPTTGLDLMKDGYARLFRGIVAGAKGFSKGFKGKRR